jgi:hypothetical protein
MSLWAKFKNYFFGVPLPDSKPVVVEEPKVPQIAPVAQPKEEPKQIDLKVDEAKAEATITVTPATVEIAPVEPVKKKAPAKKRTTKKKS